VIAKEKKNEVESKKANSTEKGHLGKKDKQRVKRQNGKGVKKKALSVSLKERWS